MFYVYSSHLQKVTAFCLLNILFNKDKIMDAIQFPHKYLSGIKKLPENQKDYVNILLHDLFLQELK